MHWYRCNSHRLSAFDAVAFIPRLLLCRHTVCLRPDPRPCTNTPHSHYQPRSVPHSHPIAEVNDNTPSAAKRARVHGQSMARQDYHRLNGKQENHTAAKTTHPSRSVFQAKPGTCRGSSTSLTRISSVSLQTSRFVFRIVLRDNSI